MAVDAPDIGAVLEIGEAIRNGRLNDAPLRAKPWFSIADSHPQNSIESTTPYEKWRQCDGVISSFKDNIASETRDKAYLSVVLCTGRALCPQVTESWAHCVKHWKGQHVQQCVFVKRMVERCVRVEGGEMLRKMDPSTFDA
ncbi:Aste57867_18801 [Aphanomyces stellatus]|uniref:Aste57867_18801 protein n=1 Tax=Aphanomyces stellatus TaxID=120398 RepID=A0A485LB91_9STRA|nr:hypothetical protein As57867_018737 [Aphanomyces stellatus]VFT95535.1 Aste57867_18801 [Aphanomyces stellatus]